MSGNAHAVVVGAGPAGLAAAIWCLRGGMRVTLVTGSGVETRWRDDDASESAHVGIESIMQQLGAGTVLNEANRGRYDGIWTNDVFAPLGGDAQGPWRGYHLNRRVFDAGLLTCALRLGADVHYVDARSFLQEDGRVVGVDTSSGPLLGDFCVDASGRRRLGARGLGIRQHFLSPPLLVQTGRHPLAAGRRDPELRVGPRGWTWTAPEKDGSCTWMHLSVRDGSAPSARSPCPRWWIHEALAVPGLWMVGDAAGTLDPTAGQGLVRALWSGIMAGNALSKIVLSAPEAAVSADYEAWFRRGYGAMADELAHRYASFGVHGFQRHTQH